MISGLKGKIFQLEVNKLHLEVAGVIYELWIPFKTFDVLKEIQKEEVLVYVYHSITDRSEKLFGFHTRKDRDLFELLKSLQGIGEMTALRVLSFLGAEELVNAVNKGDRARLEKIPKVKGKTSEKILFEVKQNIKKFEVFLDSDSENPVHIDSDNKKDLALLALMQLGYDEKTATREVQNLLKKGLTETADLIREVLKIT